MTKKLLLYLIRWQLSTPILWSVIYLLTDMPLIWQTIIANLVGGLIFFWVDRWIFTRRQTKSKEQTANAKNEP